MVIPAVTSGMTVPVIRNSMDKAAMESSQLMQKKKIKEIHTVVLSVKNQQNKISLVAHRILQEIIYDCTYKARKAAIEVPAVQVESNVGGFLSHYIKLLNYNIHKCDHLRFTLVFFLNV